MNKALKHQLICERLNGIYKKKNTDYGNSFSEAFKEFGSVSAVVQMDHKMRRIKQLIKHDPKVVEESLEDSVTDIVNYGIMFLIELAAVKESAVYVDDKKITSNKEGRS